MTLTCTDGGGLSSSCFATVTVVDAQAPQIACPSAVVAECTGNLSASVTLPAATVTDNCPAPGSVGGGQASYPMGVTDVAYTASDRAGNTSTCHTSVTVVDTQPPTLALVGPEELGWCRAAARSPGRGGHGRVRRRYFQPGAGGGHQQPAGHLPGELPGDGPGGTYDGGAVIAR